MGSKDRKDGREGDGMRLASFIIGVILLLSADTDFFDAMPREAVYIFFVFIPLTMILVPLFLEFFERRR